MKWIDLSLPTFCAKSASHSNYCDYYYSLINYWLHFLWAILLLRHECKRIRKKLRVTFLVFGNIFSLLWQKLYNIGLFISFKNGQTLKNNLTVGSYCVNLSTQGSLLSSEILTGLKILGLFAASFFTSHPSARACHTPLLLLHPPTSLPFTLLLSPRV